MVRWQDRHQVVPAVYVLMREGDKVLILKRKDTGYRDGEYSMPSGHLDGGESAVVAAAREAREEAGVTIDPKDLKLVHVQHRVADEGDHERVNLFFEAKKWQGTPQNAEPHKCSEIRWASMDELPPDMLPEVQRFFRHLKAGNVYGDFGF